jgi:sporulation protein YqfC
MNGSHPVGRKITDWFDLPLDVWSDQSAHIEWLGRESVQIENHQGIQLFCPQEIQVQSGEGLICIAGKGLRIKAINQYAIQVIGEIETIGYRS